VEKFIFYKIIK